MAEGRKREYIGKLDFYVGFWARLTVHRSRCPPLGCLYAIITIRVGGGRHRLTVACRWGVQQQHWFLWYMVLVYAAHPCSCRCYAGRKLLVNEQ